MFDIGGWEFLIIVIIALVVIGPKDLPATIRNVSGWVRKARELAREFQSGLSDIARETELDTVRDDIKQGLGLDDGEDIGNRIQREIEQSIDPDGAIRESIEADDDPDDLDDLDDMDDLEPDEGERARLIAEESGEDDPETFSDETSSEEAGPDDPPASAEEKRG